MTRRIMISVLAMAILSTTTRASDTGNTAYSFENIDFLIGHWLGSLGNMTFEEGWFAPAGGVMTGMARGHTGGDLNVLEYLIITEEDDGLIMRFKHFHSDFRPWESEPIELALTAHADGAATFTATAPETSVRSIRYFLTDKETLKAEVTLKENDQERLLSIILSKKK